MELLLLAERVEGGMAVFHESENVNACDRLCVSLVSCPLDTRRGIDLCPVLCIYPSPYHALCPFRRHIASVRWSFDYYASSAKETGVNDEKVLPVCLRSLETRTYPYEPCCRRMMVQSQALTLSCTDSCLVVLAHVRYIAGPEQLVTDIRSVNKHASFALFEVGQTLHPYRSMSYDGEQKG